jgi:hypothetical protein
MMRGRPIDRNTPRRGSNNHGAHGPEVTVVLMCTLLTFFLG